MSTWTTENKCRTLSWIAHRKMSSWRGQLSYFIQFFFKSHKCRTFSQKCGNMGNVAKCVRLTHMNLLRGRFNLYCHFDYISHEHYFISYLAVVLQYSYGAWQMIVVWWLCMFAALQHAATVWHKQGCSSQSLRTKDWQVIKCFISLIALYLLNVNLMIITFHQ